MATLDSMYDNTRGGNDTLIGVDDATNALYGDAYEMHDDTRGGNDTLTGGANATNELFGRRLHPGTATPTAAMTRWSVAPMRPTLSMAMPTRCTTTPAAAMTR